MFWTTTLSKLRKSEDLEISLPNTHPRIPSQEGIFSIPLLVGQTGASVIIMSGEDA